MLFTKKKLIFLVFFLIINITQVLDKSAFCVEKKEKTIINPFWEKRFGKKVFEIFPQIKVKPQRKLLLEQTASSYQDYKIILIRALRNKTTQISISLDPYVDKSQFTQWSKKIWEELEKEIPWLWMSLIHWEYRYWSIDNKVIKTTYSITYAYDHAKENQLEKDLISRIADILSPDMDMITREKTIHDWIVIHTSYDLNALNGNNPLAYTDYGAFENGLAVCEGYSILTNRMLYMAGIENMIISGTAINEKGSEAHAWNIVRLFDNWYHLDITWDDPIGEAPDYIGYNYFNLSDKEISKNHFWDKNKYPNAQKHYNENEYLGRIEHKCSIFEPKLCNTEIECIRICGNWVNGKCQVPILNQAPDIDSFTANPLSGTAPLTVTFTCQPHDPDGSITSYKWDFDGDGTPDQETTTGTVTYTYNTAGVYNPTVWVFDDKGASKKSDPLTIRVNLPKGDLNADGKVDLKDAIIALKITAGLSVNQKIYPEAEPTGDGKIGLDDAIFILRKLAQE
ncbi:hypothetical protein JCM12298_20210 [Desulfothermus naphthae]